MTPLLLFLELKFVLNFISNFDFLIDAKNSEIEFYNCKLKVPYNWKITSH